MKSVDSDCVPRKAARRPFVRGHARPVALAERASVAAAGDDLGAAAARALGPLVVRDLGSLREAVRTGQVRLLAIETTDGGPLPSDWALPLEGDEVVVALARLPGETCEGVAALIVARAALPRPKLDDEFQDRVASSLADALLAEVCR